MAKLTFDNLLLGVLGACALVVTGLVVRNELRPDPNAPPPPRQIAQWKQYAAHGFAEGPDSAKVTMVVFGDFQCPYCRRFATVLDSMHTEFPTVRIVERHYPLTAIHPWAYTAALAAECAGEAGKYAPMRSQLYARQAMLEQGLWGALASSAGVNDTMALSRCIQSRTHADVVERDLTDGRRLGVQATPTVMINETLYAVPPTSGELRAKLREAVAHGR